MFKPRVRGAIALICLLVSLVISPLLYPALASITLRVIVVNPSDQMTQPASIKVYLPMEVKPEDVIAKNDLEIAYDTQQGSYYVFGEYQLKPKEMLEKEVEINDIWVIDETQMVALRKEAKEVFSGFEKTAYAERASALYKGVEKKLNEIDGIQGAAGANPAQHISNYRYCLTLFNEVKADLVAAKTLLAEIGPKGAAKLTWMIIVFIIGFLGVLSLGFYVIWQHQAKFDNKNSN